VTTSNPTLPPEQRACRQRADDEQAALAAIAPTTGAPYDAYDFLPGCTGHIREDIDWGDQLTHDRPCPVHTLRDLLTNPAEED
jgi:hypothetical protein